MFGTSIVNWRNPRGNMLSPQTFWVWVLMAPRIAEFIFMSARERLQVPSIITERLND